jgi:hypothetical protein
MATGRRLLAVMATAVALLLAAPAVARAAPSISLAGDVTIESPRLLTVPIEATCDPVGQESTFIVVTVAQGPIQTPSYVDGQGDVLTVTCDSVPHTYDVAVPLTFGRGVWRPGEASLTAILSYCFRAEDGTLSCTTQAFIRAGTPITLVRR